jgi:hypothetical protein
MYEPDDGDVLEQDGGPQLPGWVRLPRWLSALGPRPSRGAAAILGIAGLIIGLAAGYALGDRHTGQVVRPLPPAAASAAPSAVASSAAAAGQPAVPGGSGNSSTYFGTLGLTALVQTGRECSAQQGRYLQLGVEVINLSATAVTLGQVKPILPIGGLRVLSQQWAPCGTLSSSVPAANGGAIVYVGPAAGATEAASAIAAAGAAVLPQGAAAWLSATFRVQIACPGPLPVQFKVSYQENGRTLTAKLPGFSDLSQVPYTGCKASP